MDYVASAVMQKDVKTVPPTMTVAELEAFFSLHNVSGFAVVDDGKLVGVVSRSDVLAALSPNLDVSQIIDDDESGIEADNVTGFRISETLGDRANTLQVKDIMTTDVLTVGPNDYIHEAADIMYRQRIHRIFVTQEDRLEGIITPFDFVRLYAQDRIGAQGRDETQEF